MRVSFVWPSSNDYAGGVKVLWEWANGLARRGHEVHFIHGPAWANRINRVEELPPFDFDDRVTHHIVDELDDPALPDGDIVFHPTMARRFGLPVVIIQGFKMVWAAWERDSFRALAPKACVASWLCDVGREFGVPDEQLWHVPLGMDHDVFTLTTPLDQRPFDVAMLYNMHKQKGWDVGLPALEELHRRRPGLRSVVFGIYPPPDPLPEGAVVMEGLDHAELAERVYNASRIFVQPSRHEGFGYTAVEAMACGAALVTTDNGGSRDYGIPGETALVVPSEDVDGLARSVETLLDDDALRMRLASEGAQHVRRFDWNLSAEILEQNLEAYLADPERFREAPAESPAGRGAG